MMPDDGWKMGGRTRVIGVFQRRRLTVLDRWREKGNGGEGRKRMMMQRRKDAEIESE